MVATRSVNGNGDYEPRQRQMQTEIKDVLSALTSRLGRLGRSTARSDGSDAEHGFGTITLTGENNGATMKAEIEELMESGTYGDISGMRTYANSNYQAVNNSILLGGSTTAEDPGVHVDIKEYIEEEAEEEEDEEEEDDDKQEGDDHEKEKKDEKKNRKKEKEKKKKEKEDKKKKKKEEEEKEKETKKKKKKKEEEED